MEMLTARVAGTSLYSLIEKTKEFHEPIIISGHNNNGVLISEEDWNAIQETLYLCSIPGMRESIIKARQEPLEDSEDIGW